MDRATQKSRGAYYTPDDIVRSLVCWAVRRDGDRLLDPSCGDGRFIRIHPNSVGVEQDPQAATIVHETVPGSLIHQGDFFAWASDTHEKFECAVGNPPFIRYQRFSGHVREAALSLCARHGVKISSLTSSWAPFLIATATLLKSGGRMSFVVPAEIGHAPYARPVLQFFVSRFAKVQVIAIRKKLFPELSENCWLLFLDGYGSSCEAVQFTELETFRFSETPPGKSNAIALSELHRWGWRLRPFLMSSEARDAYVEFRDGDDAIRLGDIASVVIGYVTGDNEFFHLKPSVANKLGIPASVLLPTVRNGKALRGGSITKKMVQKWMQDDEPIYLLHLNTGKPVPSSVMRYLDTPRGREARQTYKCRNRDPWYVVPDVSIPDAFLSYMSGETPTLALNLAGCAGTNSVHVVTFRPGISARKAQDLWSSPLTELSCEIEGHPLGGGMLKLEPREASQLLISKRSRPDVTWRPIVEGLQSLRQWRLDG